MRLFSRRATALLHVTAAFVVLAVTHSVLAFSVTMAVNPIVSQSLYTSYNRINVLTEANMVSMDSKAQEELWVKRILMGAEQANVFSDEMIGGPGSGKPFIQYDDLSKVDGNTIHVPTLAPLGGPGAQGESDRSGNEEKLRIGGFPCQIGRQWFGLGITDVAQEETVIGSQFDNVANKLLRTRLGRKISEDLMMNLRNSALTSTTAPNVVRPNFKATREALKSADVVSTSLITKAGLLLSGNGGKPVGTIKNPAGGMVEQFLFFSSQFALAPLNSETAYLQALQYAENRGKGNPIFKGDFVDWNGHGIYRWYVRDHEAYGPVGSVLVPRAFLGTAIVADNNLYDILGGGDTTGATLTPAPAYFEAFSNAPWTFTNGLTIAADVSTTRYVAIMNLTGANAGKIGFYAYQVNTGNKLTMTDRLRAASAGNAHSTVGNVTWNTAPWLVQYLTDSHPVGSLILECNSYGVPFCFSLMLGEMAGICGYGSLKGRNARAARTEEHRNHGMDHGIGVEACFGSAATKRADGKYPNFVLAEHAYPVDGFPTVT